MNSILLGAIGGAIGGALGGLVGNGLGRAIKPWNKQASRVSAVAAAILALCGARIAVFVGQPSIEGQIEQASPTLKVVHRYYPAVFQSIVAEAKTVDASDIVAVQNRIRPRLADLVGSHRGQMDDATTGELLQLTLDEATALQATSPQSCVGLLTDGKTTVDITKAIPPELIRRDGEVTARAIEQFATRPASPAAKLTDQEAAALARVAIGQLPPADRQVVAPLLVQQKPPATPDQARAMCTFYRSFFAAALNGPTGTVRRLLAG
jgi:hypothetical protein